MHLFILYIIITYLKHTTDLHVLDIQEKVMTEILYQSEYTKIC